MVDDNIEFEEDIWIDVDIEGEILGVIDAGAGSTENIGLRPLRELIQNADDAQSDRIAIRFDSDAMTFWNDGLTLTRDPEERLGGTFEAIKKIKARSKKGDEETSGQFGSGFRSCHLYTDSAEIMGRVRYPDKETAVAVICSPFDRRTENNRDEFVEIVCRNESERPKREVGTGPISERKGVRFRFPWRTSVSPTADPQWGDYLWKKERVEELAKEFVREIPRMLLGCRWIREAVLCINLAGNSKTHSWTRSFNIQEFVVSGESAAGWIEHRVADRTYKGETLLTLSSESLEEESREYFCILVKKAGASDARFAKESKLEPYCMLIVPVSPSGCLPAYTPISLTEDSGNAFGPLSFLPPHESRTKVKIVGHTSASIGSAHVSWLAAALDIFIEELLDELYTLALGMAEDESGEFNYYDFLNLLPKNRPDFWFSDVGLADHAPGLERKWDNYTEGVSDWPIIPSGKTAVLPEDSVLIDGFDSHEQELIAPVVESLGRTVIDDKTREILGSLENWGDNNPLSMAEKVNSPLALKTLVHKSKVQLKIDDLGEEVVRQLIRTVIAKPSGKWIGDDNREKLPVIPDADGILRPLKEEDSSHYFFEDVADLPDLLPSTRTIHPDYVNELEGVELGVVNPAKLAEFVDESVRSNPARFSRLQEDDSLWLQVSKAAGRIVTADDFKIRSVRDFSFLPCLHRGSVSVREVSRVEDKVWGVDVQPGGAWFNFPRREFIFGDSPNKRKNLELHDEVISNLTWLDLHPETENYREEMKEPLKMHDSGGNTEYVNIIRTLIFGYNWQEEKWGKPAISLFHMHEDGVREIDRWLDDQKLTNKKRDEILYSLLEILPTDTEDSKAKLSGQWGAEHKTDLPKLHLLKGANGEWQKLGDLCYELDSKLGELFNKTPVHPDHKEKLSFTVLTRDIGDGGLGITTRIREEEIVDRLTSLQGFSDDASEIRDGILGMMLDSQEEWVLDNLGTMEWIHRTDGAVVPPSEAILPTSEMKSLLGKNHPWFVNVDSDTSSSEVRKRVSEIGLIHDHEDPDSLLNALLGPDEIWQGLTGVNIIEALTKAWKNSKDKFSNTHTKRNRLPNSEGEWSDGSWLCDQKESGAISSIFTNRNVSDRDSLGSKVAENMAKEWIIKDTVPGPNIFDLLTKLERETEESVLSQLWSLVVARKELIQDSDIPDDANELLVPIGRGTIVRLGDIVFTGPKSKGVASSESITSLSTIDSKFSLKDVLERFGALNLESVSPNDLQRLSNESLDNDHSESYLQKLWLGLAMVEMGEEELLKGEYWPYQSRDLSGIEPAIIFNKGNRRALFPMKSDKEENITRMISDGLPMFLLPRLGALMDKIYQRLESDKEGEVPFLSRNCRRQVEGGKTEQPHPYLKNAIFNIVKAMGKLGLKIERVKTVEVNSTNEPISGTLEASIGPGSRRVMWKADMHPPNVDASVEEGVLKVLVSTNRQNDRSEADLVKALTEAISTRSLRTKDVNTISDLIRTEENQWNEIDEVLSGTKPNHERPLIQQALYATIRADLRTLYDCCQFCERQTPKNRAGELMEGVVQIFQARGEYSTRSVPYDLGNSLYLCPVHKDLHHNSLMQIQEIDDAIKEIRKNPSAKKQAVENLLSGSGSITWTVITYERETGKGEMGDVEKEVVWKGKHAKALRRTVAGYLDGL